MENNIEDYMKIDSVEKSDEFYYDGVPKTVTFNKEEYNESTLADSYKTAKTGGIAKVIRTGLTITQEIFVLIGILLIIKGISNFKKNGQMKEDYNELSGDTNPFDGDKRIRNESVFLYFVFSGVLFFACLIIHIMKNYASNL